MQVPVNPEKHDPVKIDHSDVNDKTSNANFYRDYVKRILDVLISCCALVLLFSPMLLIASLIKIDSPREHVLFKQTRIGKKGKPFTIFKFRTMSENAPHHIATENFDNPQAYITQIGRLLRKSSLDELPQLINVIRGDMSLIGPRPLIPEEDEVIRMRHDFGADSVLPGITGLAQVRGRDELSGLQKAKYDSFYVKHTGGVMDLKIFCKTIADVLHSKGIHDGD